MRCLYAVCVFVFRMMMEWMIHHKEVVTVVHSIMMEIDSAIVDLERRLESRRWKRSGEGVTVAVTCSTGRSLSPCIVECLHDHYSKAPPIDNLVVTAEHLVALCVPSDSRHRLIWQQFPMLSGFNPLRVHRGVFHILQCVRSPDWVNLPVETSMLVEEAFQKNPLSSNIRVKDLVVDFRNGTLYSKTTSQQSLLRCSLPSQHCAVTVRFLYDKTYKLFVANFKSAGILPYSFHPVSGEAVFLIGHMTYGSHTWCDFGGLKSMGVFR